MAVEALEVLPCCLAPLDDGVWMWWPTARLRSRLQVDAVEHRFNSDDYGIELVPMSPGLLYQHIKLCLDPLPVVCKHYKVPSSKETTSIVTLTRKYSLFTSSASLSARRNSFAFSSQSRSMAWRSWPSSTSCSTSTIVVSNNMTVQQCKAKSPIRHTFSLLGDIFELLRLALQLHGKARHLLRASF